MQTQLQMLNEHDDSEDSDAISHLLEQAYYLLRARIPLLPERPKVTCIYCKDGHPRGECPFT
jgi:hypothetical protein